MTKIKLRVLNFGYVIAIGMTIMYIAFQMNPQVLLIKSYGKTHLTLLQMS